MTSSNDTMNQQPQSPLLCFPAEIRNMIYRYAFTAASPIVDPTILHSATDDGKEDDDREIPISRNRSIPALGTALLQTCRLVRSEADVRTLYSCNTFAFTSVTTAHFFLTSLSPVFVVLIRDVELDVRDMGSGEYGFCYESIGYLSPRPNDDFNQFGSLRKEAPGLQVLRLNFSSWPTMRLKQSQMWALLHRMLNNVSGLDRVVLLGASKGGFIDSIEAWKSVHYAGTDCPSGGPDNLLTAILDTVGNGESEEDKLVRWSIFDGKVKLEALSEDYSRTRKHERRASSTVSDYVKGPWPTNGFCTAAELRRRFPGDGLNFGYLSPTSSE